MPYDNLKKLTYLAELIENYSAKLNISNIELEQKLIDSLLNSSSEKDQRVQIKQLNKENNELIKGSLSLENEIGKLHLRKKELLKQGEI
jgi:hypothetical protein